jgi:hypothetical protein
MPTQEERDLVAARVSALPAGVRFGTLSGVQLSRDEALSEISKGSPEGDLIVEQQINYLKKLKG